MKTKIYWAVLSSAIVLAMTACGTISPPLQSTSETTTTIATAESLPDSAASSEAESTVDEEQVKSNTFIAEFFDSNISFVDVSTIVTEAMKGCSFENENDDSNGIQKISLKGKNGGGMIDVLCVDLSQSNLDYDMKYILENLGDHYFSQTAVSKGKYQRYASIQKTDGMASQFGYTETYAVLSENKLTVVSGAFLSSDMMERQSFSQVMGQFRECVGG